MLRLILSRLALAVPVLVCVSIVAFVLLRLAPGDPAVLQAGADAGPEVVAAVRHELALDQPWPVQYAAWASKVAQGDLGGSDPRRGEAIGGLRTMLLPALALALAQVGIVARLARSSMLEVVNQEYITAARAFGVSETELMWRDALRNAMLPVLTVLGIIAGFLLGGSVVIESVFGIAGLGRLLVESFGSRDYPVTIGVMLFIAVVFVLVNLVVDVLY